jgi:hypothetical protein
MPAGIITSSLGSGLRIILRGAKYGPGLFVFLCRPGRLGGGGDGGGSGARTPVRCVGAGGGGGDVARHAEPRGGSPRLCSSHFFLFLHFVTLKTYEKLKWDCAVSANDYFFFFFFFLISLSLSLSLSFLCGSPRLVSTCGSSTRGNFLLYRWKKKLKPELKDYICL